MLLRVDRALLEILLLSVDARAIVDRQRVDRIAHDGAEPNEHADAMNAVNPLYIPWNHLVEVGLETIEARDRWGCRTGPGSGCGSDLLTQDSRVDVVVWRGPADCTRWMPGGCSCRVPSAGTTGHALP